MIDALSGSHFGGERLVDPGREGRVRKRFRGNARVHDLKEVSLEGRPGIINVRGEKGVPRCGREKVINFGNISFAV